jgi:hypothetical protein
MPFHLIFNDAVSTDDVNSDDNVSWKESNGISEYFLDSNNGEVHLCGINEVYFHLGPTVYIYVVNITYIS